MHPHIELRLTRIIFQLVIWIIAISIVNTEEKLHSALRISVGTNTKEEDIDKFIEIYNEINK